MHDIGFDIASSRCQELGSLLNCYVGLVPDWQSSEKTLYHIISGADPNTGMPFPGYSLITSRPAKLDEINDYLNHSIKLSKLRIDAIREMRFE